MKVKKAVSGGGPKSNSLHGLWTIEYDAAHGSRGHWDNCSLTNPGPTLPANSTVVMLFKRRRYSKVPNPKAMIYLACSHQKVATTAKSRADHGRRQSSTYHGGRMLRLWKIPRTDGWATEGHCTPSRTTVPGACTWPAIMVGPACGGPHNRTARPYSLWHTMQL